MNNSQFLLYEKIADAIRKRVADDTYPLQSRIPSEVDLAAEFKVSRPTVKSAVEALVKEGVLECRPATGSFVKRKPVASHLIGYIAPNLSDPFHAEMVRALDSGLKESGNGLLIAESGESAAASLKAIQRLKESGARGVLVSDGIGNAWQKLASVDLPLVWCAGIPETDQVDRVSIDHDASVKKIVEHLVSINVRSVGYGAVRYADLDKIPHYKAFARYCQESGLTTRKSWQVITDKLGEESGRLIFDKIRVTGKLPQALVCLTDWIAIGVIKQALEHGVRVPEDLKVVGYDNILIGRYLQVPVTTVDYRIPDLVKTALKILSAKIDDPARAPETVLLDGELIIRQSTAGSWE